MKIKCPHCGEEFDYEAEVEFNVFQSSVVEYAPKSFKPKVLPVDLPSIEGLPQANPFNKVNVCFTGFSDSDKAYLKDVATRIGMNVKSSVSGKLNLLVCGPNPGPGKLRDATELGIKIVSFEEFKASLDNARAFTGNQSG